ncbi:MAG TPA: TetR family transcriptional regulator [Thermomicrobiales bacterium]|jgi:AcrR family transcriptional regulator
MGDATPAVRVRDADRSRELILEASERLFAERGYEATSLQEIGRAAGVSRGTPGYFFGSKEQLYRAVLERALAAELAFVLAAQERAVATGGGATEALAAVVAGLLDFLAARPSFVRLLERESLTGGQLLRDTAAHAAALREGLATMAALLALGGYQQADPAAVLLDLLALCWFPFAHADTFARDLGFDLLVRADRERWGQHVVDLLLRGLPGT